MAVLAASLIDSSQMLSDKRNDASLAPADWLTMVNWSIKSLWRFVSSLDPDWYFSQLDFTLAGGVGGSTFDLTTVQAPCLPTASQANVPIAVSIPCDGTNTGITSTPRLQGLGSPFLPTDAGCTVVIAGTASNNGTFTVAAYVSALAVNLSGTPVNEIFPTSATVTLFRHVGAEFRALHGLDWMPGTTGRRTVPRRNFLERNKGRIGSWIPTLWCQDRAYDIRGLILNITPYEVAGGPYRVYYRYAPYLFTSPTDATALDAQLEPYDEYLAVLTARKALGIEESDQGPPTLQLTDLKQEIIDEHELDDESPSVIADTEDDDESLGVGRYGGF